MTLRLFGSGVSLLAILVLPYWIYIPVLFMAIILIPFFWEGIVLVFLIEIIHSSGILLFSLFVSPLSLLVLVLLIVVLPLRDTLRAYV